MPSAGQCVRAMSAIFSHPALSTGLWVKYGATDHVRSQAMRACGHSVRMTRQSESMCGS